jgi:hypothetical protein
MKDCYTLAKLQEAYIKKHFTIKDVVIELMITAQFHTPEETVALFDHDLRMKLKEWVERAPDEEIQVLTSYNMRTISVETVRSMKAYFKEHPEG